MVGVIIAAGKGVRLSKVTKGMPKTLLSIKGKPIIQWIIDVARNAGINDIFVITGYKERKIKEYFSSNPDKNVALLYNQDWQGGNGISVLRAAEAIETGKPFLLMMSDHLIEEGIVKSFVNQKKKYPLIAIEKNIDKVFDIDDATKIYIENKQVKSIGKKLRNYNAVDAGLFIFDKSIFKHLKKSIKYGRDTLTDGICEMIKKENLCVYSIPKPAKWIDIDSEETFNIANKMWRKK
jgi:choline kinase